MLGRLLLAILLAAFAVPAPASAPCHGPMDGAMLVPPAAAPMPGHGMGHDRHPAPAHLCIGCVPLPDAVAPAPAFVPAPAPMPRLAPVSADLRAGGPPASPPPRIG